MTPTNTNKEETISIKINKKKIANVKLSKNAFSFRTQGLIQYLSYLCETIQWDIIEEKQQ